MWTTLAHDANQPLRDAAQIVDPHDVAGISRLRKHFNAELVHAALQLSEARRKALPKFGGEISRRLWADPTGVEMATSRAVAEHKAARFASQPKRSVLDACCGIGGDAMSLAREMEVTCLDIEPTRAWMAGVNTGRLSRCEDVTTADFADDLLHIDPARRIEQTGARRWSLSDMRPRPAELVTLFKKSLSGGAIKLGPGVNAQEVQSALPHGELEFISEAGRLTQAVLWIGQTLATRTGRHIATLIDQPSGESLNRSNVHQLQGTPGLERPIAPEFTPSRYLYEPDDSVERAELLHELCRSFNAPLLHPALGLLTSDSLITSPWCTRFEVLAFLPWHVRAVRAELHRLGAGIVEVKTRGGAVNPDVVQRELRQAGDYVLTVFILRFECELKAIIARREPRSSPHPRPVH